MRFPFSPHRASFLLAVFVVLVGCTGTKEISRSKTALPEINKSLRNVEAIIVWQSGETMEEALSVHLTPDSIRYQNVENPREARREQPFAVRTVETHTRPIEEVRRIESPINPGGGWIGFGIGATPGSLLSISWLFEDCDRDSYYGCGFRDAFVLIGVMGSVSLGLVGAVVGNLVDQDARVVYRGPVERYLDS